MTDAQWVGSESVVPRQPRHFQCLCEQPELFVVAHRDRDRPISCLECLVGRDTRVTVTESLRYYACPEEARCLIDQRRQQHRHQIGVDALSLPSAIPIRECGKYPR
ncbi:Uncharacterised protein [Mycobacteroides abscessus subsp. abscessus]|nr:Uncharacterised protein [Mycobacteroides abscessus subsp. abscessus]